jgi:hypothetical protein
VAQDSSPLMESLGSKKSILPSSTFANVGGLSFKATTSGSPKGLRKN